MEGPARDEREVRSVQSCYAGCLWVAVARWDAGQRRGAGCGSALRSRPRVAPLPPISREIAPHRAASYARAHPRPHDGRLQPPADGAGQPARTHPLQSGKDPASGAPPARAALATARAPLTGLIARARSQDRCVARASSPAGVGTTAPRGRPPGAVQTTRRQGIGAMFWTSTSTTSPASAAGWAPTARATWTSSPRSSFPTTATLRPPRRLRAKWRSNGATARPVAAAQRMPDGAGRLHACRSLKRLYEAQDLVALLREAGVDDEEVVGPESDWSKDEQLAQTENAMERERMERDAEGARLAARLPLEAFDDAEYEVFAPEVRGPDRAGYTPPLTPRPCRCRSGSGAAPASTAPPASPPARSTAARRRGSGATASSRGGTLGRSCSMSSGRPSAAATSGRASTCASTRRTPATLLPAWRRRTGCVTLPCIAARPLPLCVTPPSAPP